MPRHGLLAALVLGLAGALVVAGLALGGSGSSAQAQAPSSSPFFAALFGGNEVGENGEANAGDRDGEGAFSLVVRGRQICYGLSVKGIAKPAAAHIHRGPAGVNGPVVVPLTAPAAGDPGASSGCVGGLGGALVRDILQNPQNYYANVHTGDFPGGAVRGQLF